MCQQDFEIQCRMDKPLNFKVSNWGTLHLLLAGFGAHFVKWCFNIQKTMSFTNTSYLLEARFDRNHCCDIFGGHVHHWLVA